MRKDGVPNPAAVGTLPMIGERFIKEMRRKRVEIRSTSAKGTGQ
jgi:hypothetical protein